MRTKIMDKNLAKAIKSATGAKKRKPKDEVCQLRKL